MRHDNHLILTVDYEIFGNGSGNTECCILEPAERMLSIADKFEAPLTFFVETTELIAMEKVPLMTKSINLIKEQLQISCSNGHDVQLHIHPQWLDAKYSGAYWELAMDKWRIGNLQRHEVSRLIQEGKQWLQTLLHNINKDYQVDAFRAGGWCIQPSTEVLAALREENIFVDSTVAPGRRELSVNKWFDFINAPSLPYWSVENDVCIAVKNNEATSGLTTEVPIVTGKISPFRHFQVLKRTRSSANGGMAIGCCGDYMTSKGILKESYDKVRKALGLGQVMLDFSTMPADILIELTENWILKNENLKSPIPIVAIAHTKNFTEESGVALETYLRWVNKTGIKCSTFGSWISAVKKLNE